ncbi:ETX/MTX2 family pore-forming toxin [Enterococcus mundtii]|nr:ETX/MTX2 family pore-forming toxin [Enterococcus mundtii]
MLGVVGATSVGLFKGESVACADDSLPQIGEGYLKSVNQSTIDRMSTMAFALSYQMYQWGDIGVNERLTGNEYNPKNVSSQSYSVGVNSDMGTKQTSKTVNTSVFHNQTNQDQTFTTPSYTETYIDSITTSTTHSAGISTSASTEISVPMFGSASMGLELSYNFSTTTSHTRETQKAGLFLVKPSMFDRDIQSKSIGYFIRVKQQERLICKNASEQISHTKRCCWAHPYIWTWNGSWRPPSAVR